MFDLLIILSKDRNKDGSFDNEFKARLDKGIEFYKLKKTKKIAVPGKYGQTDRHIITTHAQDMKKYLLQKGVKESHILYEEESLDTVSQAIFTKSKIVLPLKMEKIAIISSNYHLPRVKVLFDFVFGDGYKIEYFSAFDKPLTENILQK